MTNEDAAAEVLSCAAQTLLAASVKVVWREDWAFHPPEDVRRRRGGLLAPLLIVGIRLAKAAWKRATRDVHPGHLVAVGILEPRTGRYMIDFGSFAQLYDGTQMFGGRSGRRLATLDPFRELRRPDVCWALHALLGTTHAVLEGEDALHGTPCARMGVRIDLTKASAANRNGLRSPVFELREQSRALPATVWIDGKHVRRVDFPGIESRDLSLELWDYGVPTDDVDWSRLPTFKSPEEAASMAGES